MQTSSVSDLEADTLRLEDFPADPGPELGTDPGPELGTDPGPAPAPRRLPIPDPIIARAVATVGAFGLPTRLQDEFIAELTPQAYSVVKLYELGDALAEYGIGLAPGSGGKAAPWLRLALGGATLAGLVFVARWPERVPPPLATALGLLGIQAQAKAEAESEGVPDAPQAD